MIYKTKDRTFNFKRYPSTTNKSLRAWNAADELLHQTLENQVEPHSKLCISNDRFGVLANLFNTNPTQHIVAYKSQEKALFKNAKLNDIPVERLQLRSPLDTIDNFDFALLKIPKSLNLFELLIQQLHSGIADEGVIFAGFMTRHFSPKLIEIAEYYFDSVEQSKAKKKARVLTLKGKKDQPPKDLIESISYKDYDIKQYKGVFSSGHIDFATQFFLEHFETKENEQSVLDLASGNGIIAKELYDSFKPNELHLMDDSILAIESSKMNLPDLPNEAFHYSDSLEVFQDQSIDLVVSNPPFHFGHENNIEVAIQLFKGLQRILKENGRFTMVTSKHLNLFTHLDPLFTSTSILKENDRFVIYECIK